MLSGAVTADGVEAPRNLEELEMHFTAGDWAANGVLVLEADGDVCASGTGGDASDGDFSASWDTPVDGCYRVDAHSAGEECGFGKAVALTIDWCAGRTETLKYTPKADGWTALGVYPFFPGHLGGVTQQEGPVDAFRVVSVPDCKHATLDAARFGSLTIDTDAEEMPDDLASQIAYRVTNMGDALTAFFHPKIEENRRLSAGAKSTNHVVVDFDTSKLGAPFAPTEAAVKDATKLICSLLDTVECGQAASFKLDERGDASTMWGKRNVAVDAAALAGLLALAGLALAAARRRFGTARVGGAAAGPKTVVVAAKESPELEDAAEERKPDVEDDNASTVTPCSIPDSLPSEAEDLKEDPKV